MNTISKANDLPQLLREALSDGKMTCREWFDFAKCLGLRPTGRWVGNFPELIEIYKE